MSASPALIGRYTQNGVLLTYQDDLMKAAQPNAQDAGEVVSFFRYQADGLAMLQERANILGQVGPFHEAIEVTSDLGVGTRLGVTPIVPSFQVVDTNRNINVTARVRAVAFDMTIDRYSLELMQ